MTMEVDSSHEETPIPVLETGVLIDPWHQSEPVPLDGVLERKQFPPWMMMTLVLILGLVFFQLISAVAVVLLLLWQGMNPAEMISALATIVETNARELLIANTIGQVLGLALLALVFARWHSSEVRGFLRLRIPDPGLTMLSVLGLLALIPLVMWLGTMSNNLPWPESIRTFEELQNALIEKVFLQDMGLAFTLSMMALTPAICEELVFRGYVQRQAERSFGIVGGILFSGIIFGFFHLRPTQAIPLSLIGIYLAYLTWQTGSILPAMVVHLANNAIAVFIAAYAKAQPDIDLADLEKMDIPVYILLPALLILIGVVYVMQQTANARLQGDTPPTLSG